MNFADRTLVSDITARMREWDELMKSFQIELHEAHYPAEKLGKWTRMQEIYTYE